MKALWSDTIGTDLTQQWVEGSFANKLYKDTRILRKELIKAKTPLYNLCKGCKLDLYNPIYPTCVLCLKATNYKSKAKEALPLVLWYRLENKTTYNNKQIATHNGDYEVIKMVPTDNKELLSDE